MNILIVDDDANARKTLGKILKAKGFEVDVELVEVGALLHDLGRSKTHTINHVVIGAEMARMAGMPEEVLSIIKRHLGGGITAEEAKEIGWPNDGYVPTTLEEKIVSYADKLIGSTERIPVETTINKLLEEKHEVAAQRVKTLYDEMTKLIGDEP